MLGPCQGAPPVESLQATPWHSPQRPRLFSSNCPGRWQMRNFWISCCKQWGLVLKDFHRFPMISYWKSESFLVRRFTDLSYIKSSQDYIVSHSGKSRAARACFLGRDIYCLSKLLAWAWNDALFQTLQVWQFVKLHVPIFQVLSRDSAHNSRPFYLAIWRGSATVESHSGGFVTHQKHRNSIYIYI